MTNNTSGGKQETITTVFSTPDNKYDYELNTIIKYNI